MEDEISGFLGLYGKGSEGTLISTSTHDPNLLLSVSFRRPFLKEETTPLSPPIPLAGKNGECNPRRHITIRTSVPSVERWYPS